MIMQCNSFAIYWLAAVLVSRFIPAISEHKAKKGCRILKKKVCFKTFQTSIRFSILV